MHENLETQATGYKAAGKPTPAQIPQGISSSEQTSSFGYHKQGSFNQNDILQVESFHPTSLQQQLLQKVDKTKYKTEMCKNWIEIGLCRYGNKCQFAHGENELMGKAPPVNNNKYKSKTCTTFNEKLYCPYGQRCLFKHEDRQFLEVKNFFYLHRLVMLQHAFCEPYASKLLESGPVKRLKIFQTVTD